MFGLCQSVTALCRRVEGTPEIMTSGSGRIQAGSLKWHRSGDFLHPTRNNVEFDRGSILRARLALPGANGRQMIWIGGFEIDAQRRGVRRENVLIKLSPLEFDLFDYLAQRLGHPVESVELLIAIWGTTRETAGTGDQLRNSIKRLRKKLEPDPKHPRYLITIRGYGYMLDDPLKERAQH